MEIRINIIVVLYLNFLLLTLSQKLDNVVYNLTHHPQTPAGWQVRQVFRVSRVYANQNRKSREDILSSDVNCVLTCQTCQPAESGNLRHTLSFFHVRLENITCRNLPQPPKIIHAEKI